MAVHRQCVLYDRECIGCGECDRCDLDPEKICDNCMKCVATPITAESLLTESCLKVKQIQKIL